MGRNLARRSSARHSSAPDVTVACMQRDQIIPPPPPPSLSLSLSIYLSLSFLWHSQHHTNILPHSIHLIHTRYLFFFPSPPPHPTTLPPSLSFFSTPHRHPPTSHTPSHPNITSLLSLQEHLTPSHPKITSLLSLQEHLTPSHPNVTSRLTLQEHLQSGRQLSVTEKSMSTADQNERMVRVSRLQGIIQLSHINWKRLTVNWKSKEKNYLLSTSSVNISCQHTSTQ